MTLDDLFDRCVITPDGCWIWAGADSGEGRGGNYGKFCKWETIKKKGKQPKKGNRFYYAHRYAFELKTGKKVPTGFQVDHICARWPGHDGWNARRCCNPDHLESVVSELNQQRKFYCYYGGSDGLLNNEATHAA